MGILGFSLLFSNLPLSESVLWDLIIDVKLEQSPLYVGEIPVVSVSVTDHASKPVSGAEVKVRLYSDSITILTDTTGSFKVEFSEFDGLPGNYIVNVMATTSDGKIGLASTEFQVKGELLVQSYSEKILSTIEALKYLHASPDDFAKDPIGFTLYNYYQNLQEEFLDEINSQTELDKEQQLIAEQREQSIELTEQIIEEKNPEAGIYSGYKYDRFVDNLDLSVKDIIVNQLNYTVTVFGEAQAAFDEVISNGGSYQEARLAYYEKASISREVMNDLTTLNVENTTSGNFTNSTELISELNQNGTNTDTNGVGSLTLNVNGTLIDIGKAGTVIYLNINGTLVELIVNGIESSPQTNSTQN
ncbi:MAG: carboxypeptidase regulatory-like domain-containing protein [Thaumarchaeota archaeon]|nr:carboxypeptidase regulatory-like domain-containing protein [Nitrososphaerota archaeon]